MLLYTQLCGFLRVFQIKWYRTRPLGTQIIHGDPRPILVLMCTAPTHIHIREDVSVGGRGNYIAYNIYSIHACNVYIGWWCIVRKNKMHIIQTNATHYRDLAERGGGEGGGWRGRLKTRIDV